MTELFNITGEKLSLICGVAAPPSHDQSVIKNKTLGGTYHIQTIGKPVKMRQLEVVATRTNADAISDIYATGARVKLVEDNVVSYCLISEMPSWEFETKSIFRTKLTLVVKEAGTI